MRKENRVCYFSVEGETEKWYLEWLQRTINSEPAALCKARFDVKIEKNPRSRVKGLNILGKTEIIHVFDRESEDQAHAEQFHTMLDRMKSAQGMGKQVTYKLGHSNFTFELWMILHKADCSRTLSNRSQYLALLNQAYGDNFESLSQYKYEENFKCILSKLTLDDVRQAIQRLDKIMRHNMFSLERRDTPVRSGKMRCVSVIETGQSGIKRQCLGLIKVLPNASLRTQILPSAPAPALESQGVHPTGTQSEPGE